LFWVLSFALLHGCTPYTDGEPIKDGQPAKYGLLVLDMQNDFLRPDGKMPIAPGQAAGILNAVNGLLAFVAQNNIEAVYIGNEFNKSDRVANWFRNNAALAGTEGARLVDGLKIINQNYFAKHHPDAFANPDFDRYLREKEITRLAITGVFADQCVMSTVKGALQRGYAVYAVSDGLGAKSDKKLATALDKLADLGVSVLTASQLLDKLGERE